VCVCVCVIYIIGLQEESARLHAAMEQCKEQLAEVQADTKERGREKCAMETLELRLNGLVSLVRICKKNMLSICGLSMVNVLKSTDF